MQLYWTIAFALVFTLGIVSRGWSYAEARAGGHIGDGSTIGDRNTGTLTANALRIMIADDNSGDQFSSSAGVNGTTLRAGASALLATQGSSVSANASAIWVDDLEIGNPDLADLGAFLAFKPFANGEIQGNGTATFQFLVYHPVTGEELINESLTADEEGTALLGAVFLLPLHELLSPMSFAMSLSVVAGVSTTPGYAVVRYDHTAYLPPIFIADANGNPIPSLAGIQIVGSSGRAYPVTVVQRTPGDYNGDGMVDAADYVVWRHSVGQTGLTLNADGNGDQTVDEADRVVWRELFGTAAANGASLVHGPAVPEPSTYAILSIGLLAATSAVRAPRNRLSDRSPLF